MRGFRRIRHSRTPGEQALDPEGLREQATVQLILAERDYERRYVAPRKAAREAKRQAGE